MMADHNQKTDEKPGWADTEGFRKIFLGFLIVSSLLAAAAGFVADWHNPHPHFDVEGWGVFFALWGFGAFMFIVLVGQHLRKLVGRDEKYYEERE